MKEKKDSQTAQTILMVRPSAFGFNEETAKTNVFQSRDENFGDDELQSLAVSEFDVFVEELRSANVDVIVCQDRLEPRTPDAIFPNNWISMHHDGTVVLYPMSAPSRRLERRVDIVETLQQEYKFEVSRVVDLTDYENQSRFLEGTGSLVFDYPGRCIYANISARTDEIVLHELRDLFNHDLVLFRATDSFGRDIYHTNVVMSIGEGFVVICAEAIDDIAERDYVVGKLKDSGRNLVLVDRDQMCHFACNILEVENRDCEKVIIMSSQALESFLPDQLETLRKDSKIVASPIPTVERIEGGSARCMIAGVHLPGSK